MDERVTFRLTRRILGKIDGLVERGEFPSRSEAIREGIVLLLVRYDTEQSKEGDEIRTAPTQTLRSESGAAKRSTGPLFAKTARSSYPSKRSRGRGERFG